MTTAPSPAALADSIEADLRAAAQPERAEQERAYLKSDLEFLGLPVAAIRRAVAFRTRQPNLGHHAVISLVEALWAKPIFERRFAAVEVLALFRDLLVAQDIVLVERLLRESRTWGLVDDLAANIAGSLVSAHPELGATLDRWVEDEDFWISRSALLALLVPLRQGEGEPDRFFRYADRLLDEREFFIRKAIGWVLRDMSRRRPQLVRDWLAPRANRVSGVTIREAVKYLEPSDRERLMADYRDGSSTRGARGRRSHPS